MLTQVLEAEARARRVGWLALVVNVGLGLYAVLAIALAVNGAPARRYVRAGAMLSTTLVDESTLARDLGRVVHAHADAIREAVGPRWPALAERTLDANTTMERAVQRHVDKTAKAVFAERNDAMRERVQIELAQYLPGPVLTRERVDLLLAESREQTRQTVRDGVSFHVRRSRRALQSLTRELPTRASERWTERWTVDASRELDQVGRRFVAQHGGLEQVDDAAEGEP